MKKLTKTLSLVLVVAMVLSLCVIGAGATFTDNDKITKDYSEAVTIATDLGIVSGVGNNTFAPAGTFTRAQAAVILTKMTTGANAAAIAPTTQTFKDVPTSFWGYKYIEYAAQAGLVAGIGNGMFSPNATLNGYQWALMLLKVLGFDSTGMTPANWQMLTAKAYYGNSKFSSVAITNAAVTREAATQMAYDALFSVSNGKTGYPVYYKYGTADQALIGVYANLADAAVAAKTLNGEGSDYRYETYMVTMNGITLAKTVFGVTKNDTKTDAFARPATVYTASTSAQGTAYGWTNKTKAIASAPAAVYTSAVKTGKVYSDLGLTTGTTGTKVLGTSVYTNGVVGATTTNDVVINLNGTAVVGGNGIRTEVYTDANGAPTRIVMVNSYIGKVANVATGKETNGSTFTAYTINSGDKFATANTYKVYTSALNGENSQIAITGSIAKGDYVVLYTDSAKALLSASADMVYATKANLVTGKLTSYSSSTGLYTIGGTTYSQSGITTTGAGAVNAFNTNATYVLDNYGYVVGSVAVDATASYLYVTKMAYSYALNGTTLVKTVMATAMMPDGTVKTVAVATVGGSTAEVGETPITNQGLYTYTVNENGSYALSAKISNQDVTSITQKTAALNGAKSMYTNSATKYYVANWVADTKDTADDNANDKSLDGTVTTYTGYTNVPSMTISAGDASYVDADGNGIAEVVFVFRNTAVGVTTNYTYMLGTASTSNGTTFANDAIVAGQTTTVSLDAQKAQGMYVVKSGVASLVEFETAYASSSHDYGYRGWTTSNDGIYNDNYIVCNGGLLYIASSATGLVASGNFVSSVATTVPVYVISASAKTCTATTVADFTSATLGDIVVANTAGVISAIYVVVA